MERNQAEGRSELAFLGYTQKNSSDCNKMSQHLKELKTGYIVKVQRMSEEKHDKLSTNQNHLLFGKLLEGEKKKLSESTSTSSHHELLQASTVLEIYASRGPQWYHGLESVDVNRFSSERHICILDEKGADRACRDPGCSFQSSIVSYVNLAS